MAEIACMPFSSFSTATGDRYMTRPSRIQQVGTSGSNPLAMRPSAQFWFSRSTELVMWLAAFRGYFGPEDTQGIQAGKSGVLAGPM